MEVDKFEFLALHIKEIGTVITYYCLTNNLLLPPPPPPFLTLEIAFPSGWVEFHPLNIGLGNVASLANGASIGVIPGTDVKHACTVALLVVCLGKLLDQGRPETCRADLDPVSSLTPSSAKASGSSMQSHPHMPSENKC